ncbi:MAG: hypothetical protein H6988_12135, partial [Pseudomonadales bacterium]|nr:hypothetical protein [Pseudomonadales bacterium]
MIKYIHIAAASGVPQESVEVAQLVAGAGIVGDRNYGLADYPGQQITFIEMEEIDSFNRRFGQQQPPWAARRNVV